VSKVELDEGEINTEMTNEAIGGDKSQKDGHAAAKEVFFVSR
jgi:hypothetical protein